jgi:hypothetical protein
VRPSIMRRWWVWAIVPIPVACTSGGGASPVPSGTAGGVYRDTAGWTIQVAPGWRVVPFRSAKGGLSAEGAEISNVKLPRPTLVPWAPIQSDGRSLPKGGIGLVIGTNEGSRVKQEPIVDLPLTYPNGWLQGSALPGEPTLEGVWFRGGDQMFAVTVKTGSDAAAADRRTIARMIASLRFQP